MVKIYSYKYDFDQDQCIEKVKRRQERCSGSPSYRDYDDDDSYSNEYDTRGDSSRGDRYADDYSDAGKHLLSQKSHKSVTEDESIDAVDDESPVETPAPKHHSPQKEIKKLAQHIG